MSRERQPQLAMPQTSVFYHACSVNDIPRIKSLLSGMTSGEINRIEPNGRTALHTACYHDNAGLVYLLLRHGALGSIKNQHGLTPYEETTSPSIKQLLLSTGSAAWIEWTFVDPPTRETKQIFDGALESTFRARGLPFIFDYVLNHYVRRHVAEALPPASMQKIEQYFVDAQTSGSLFPVIKAYTSSTNFDKIVNRHCREILPGLLRANGNPENTLAASIFYLIASFNFDPTLRPKYAYTGRVYRGLKMSMAYIRTYRKNELIVNRPFVTTSKSVDVANMLAGFEQRNQYRKIQSFSNYWEAAVRCTYEIRHLQTRAINISNVNMSMFSKDEEEVLLMPLSTFRIIDIKPNADESEFDIFLEDCDLPSKRDSTAPIVRCDFAETANIPSVAPVFQPLNTSTMNIVNPFSNHSADWRRRLAVSIMNMSTRCTIILIIVIIIIIILVVLAILLSILLRPSCDHVIIYPTL